MVLSKETKDKRLEDGYFRIGNTYFKLIKNILYFSGLTPKVILNAFEMFNSFRIIITNVLQVLFLHFSIYFSNLNPTRISDQRLIYWFPFLSPPVISLLIFTER